jgi:acyl carrier protein
MDALSFTVNVVCSCLQLDPEEAQLDVNTPLLGGLPDFNSLTIATVIESIEEQLDCTIEDEELTGELFETVGTLAQFVETKM